MSFRSRGNLCSLVNDNYLDGKLSLGDVVKLLSLDTKSLQREAYLLLPIQDKEDHEYLIYEKPKPPPTAESLYMSDAISIHEYEDMVLPGRSYIVLHSRKYGEEEGRKKLASSLVFFFD